VLLGTDTAAAGLPPHHHAGVYMLVLCSLAVALDSAGITLKPW
jgi:hypothetical protein